MDRDGRPFGETNRRVDHTHGPNPSGYPPGWDLPEPHEPVMTAADQAAWTAELKVRCSIDRSRRDNSRRRQWLSWALFLGAMTNTEVEADGDGVRFR